MTGRTSSSTILRTATAALGLFALGGSISAVNAAEAAPVPAPSFEAAFATLGAPAAIEPTGDAVDVATLDTAEADIDDSAVEADPMPGGMASWYGAELAGHRTASGERFDPSDFTAAHRSLPLGSKVRVTYQGRSVVVRINDRGPFAAGRVIDLSKAAAERIGLRRAGSGRVELARLG